MKTNRIYNFSAGPAMLSEEVLESIESNLYNYEGSGLGLIEMSHRGKEFEKINAEAEADFRELLAIPANYSVIFTTGGATNQFSMIPLNLLKEGEIGSYLVSGVWADAAYEECRRIKKAEIVGSTKEQGFRSLPIASERSKESKYLHFTTNNTVVGSEYQSEPDSGSGLLIADASSNILSKPIDVSKYALIYAGAQKNIGTAGVTVVIILQDLLETIPNSLPIMMDYRTYTKHKSAYNTPPTFSIFVLGQVLKWMKRLGGTDYFEKISSEKAQLLYQTIDSSDFYTGYVVPEHRSRMNVTFNLPSKELEAKFVAEAEAAGLHGLAGHRLLGGIRASIYNAFPKRGVQVLVEFMREFENKKS